MRRATFAASAALVGATSVGCADSQPLSHACTEIGCSSGLRITFDAVPDSGTLVEAEAPSGPPWRVTCGVDTSCDNGVFLPDFRPDLVTIRITTPAGEVVHDLQPQYQEHRPNGPDCEPLCFLGTVEVALP